MTFIQIPEVHYWLMAKNSAKMMSVLKLLERLMKSIRFLVLYMRNLQMKILKPAIEEMIQKLETGLSPLSNFILSGSGLLSAHIQFARALVRTAERRVGALRVKNENIMPFLNRLSDLLFQMARKVDQTENRSERLWKGE